MIKTNATAASRFRLLNGNESRNLFPQLNAFENAIFGPDFACETDAVQHWIDSDAFFYSALVSQSESNQTVIHAVASILLTSEPWRQKLIGGELPDYGLRPWPEDKRQEPVLYLASVISTGSRQLHSVYGSLTTEISAYLESSHLTVNSAFSIAAGSAGLKHLQKCGFRPRPGLNYLDRYPILEVERSTAVADLWQTVLSPPRQIRRAA